MSSLVALGRWRSRGRSRPLAILSGVLLSAALSGMGCSTSSGGPTGTAGALSAGATGLAGAGLGGSAAGGVGMAGSPGGSGGSVTLAGASGDSGSGGTPAGGNAGAGGAATAMWTTNGSKYSLTLGSTYFEVDAALGGRITALRVGGKDLLSDAAATGQEYYWGSTFWPSPQNWALPPTGTNTIATIDNQPYTVKLAGDVLTLTSALNTAPPAVVVTKKFSADIAKEAIVIEYTMTNAGTIPVTVAPWEVTRVAAGGLTFYPEASPPVLHDQSLTLPPTTVSAGVRWFQHDASVAKATKFFADGNLGWVAHVTGASNDLLLIKTFPDIVPSQSPPGEAEIEIYAAQKYVEVEQQGAVQTLAVGESSAHWTVRWYARKLSTPAVAGSADLISYVQNQIK